MLMTLFDTANASNIQTLGATSTAFTGKVPLNFVHTVNNILTKLPTRCSKRGQVLMEKQKHEQETCPTQQYAKHCSVTINNQRRNVWNALATKTYPEEEVVAARYSYSLITSRTRTKTPWILHGINLFHNSSESRSFHNFQQSPFNFSSSTSTPASTYIVYFRTEVSTIEAHSREINQAHLNKKSIEKASTRSPPTRKVQSHAFYHVHDQPPLRNEAYQEFHFRHKYQQKTVSSQM